MVGRKGGIKREIVKEGSREERSVVRWGQEGRDQEGDGKRTGSKEIESEGRIERGEEGRSYKELRSSGRVPQVRTLTAKRVVMRWR